MGTASTRPADPRGPLPKPAQTSPTRVGVGKPTPKHSMGTYPRGSYQCSRVAAQSEGAPQLRSSLTTTGSLARVLAWNSHTLNASKFLAVKSKISDYSPDAVIITEAELDISDKPHVPGYITLLPRVCESITARTVMFIKESLHPKQLESPVDIPVVVAQVGKVVLLGVYRQFSMATSNGTVRDEPFEIRQLDALEEFVRSISDKFTTVYLMGDINLDPSRLEDTSYYRHNMLTRWLDLMEELGMSWFPTGPTFMSYGKFDGQHKTSVLDHFYSRTNCSVNVRVLNDGLSDHKPILAQIGKAPVKKPDRQTRRERNWKALSKPVLEMSLLDSDWSNLLATTCPNEAVALLIKAMSSAIDLAVPEKTYCTPNLNVRLSKETRRCMRARDLAKSQGKEHYKRLRNKCLSMIRRDHINHNLQRVRRGGQAAAWSVINHLTGKSRGRELPLPNGAGSAKEAADMSNSHYVEKVLNLRKDIKSNMTLTEAVSSDTGFKFHCIGTQALKRALHSLQNKTSVGVDKIPIGVIKAGWSALALPLVHIVNLVIKSGQWPDQWKQIMITPVYKQGKPPLEVSSYRPVALLCAVSKLTERVLYDQIMDFVEEQGLLHNDQHGFRKNRSTNSALASMMSRVGAALDKGMKVGISCFDFSSAFDTVSSTVLDHKLGWATTHARKLIKDYLTGGHQTVIWNGAASEGREILFGVRQGSILGPLLYIILTGDLPDAMCSNIGPAAKALASCYADDSTGVSISKSWHETDKAMEKVASNLAEYSTSVGLYLNLSKTQTLRLNHTDTSKSSTVNVLGVQINKSGGFSIHHKSMIADLRSRLGAVRRLATAIGRGKLLREVGQSLVLGKVQTNAFVTREAKLQAGPEHEDDVATQVVLNDLYRVIIGSKRTDHIRVADLAARANLPTLNEIITKQAAISAWRSQNGGPLHDILMPYDERTRGSSENRIRPVSTRCVASRNLAHTWNASEELRNAKTLSEAKLAAKKLAQTVRNL